MRSIRKSTFTLVIVVVLALAAFVPMAAASKVGIQGAQLAQTTLPAINASADTFVRSTSGNNFGDRVYLGVDGAGTVEHTLIQFVVAGVPAGATIDSAVLRIQVRSLTETEFDSTSDGTNETVLVTTTGAFDEFAVTWATAPACGATVGSFGPTTPSLTYEVNITSAITGDGTYNFCLRLQNETSGDGVKFHSRQTATGTGPQLVITYTVGGVEPPPDGGGGGEEPGAPAPVVRPPGADMVPIPDWATGGKVVGWTHVYYEPLQGAAGVEELAPGTSIWVYGQNSTRQFYLAMLAGKLFWLPVGMVGPNYEDPWYGRPLPTQLVDGEGNAL